MRRVRPARCVPIHRAGRFEKIGDIARTGLERRYQAKQHFVLAQRLMGRKAVWIPLVEDAAGGSEFFGQAPRQNREDLVGLGRPRYPDTREPRETSGELISGTVRGARQFEPVPFPQPSPKTGRPGICPSQAGDHPVSGASRNPRRTLD